MTQFIESNVKINPPPQVNCVKIVSDIERSGYSLIMTMDIYSTDIKFLHRSTGRLPMPGFIKRHAMVSGRYSKHINDKCSLRMRTVFSYKVIHTYMSRTYGHTVVYNARAAHAFGAGIKCRHCIRLSEIL